METRWWISVELLEQRPGASATRKLGSSPAPPRPADIQEPAMTHDAVNRRASNGPGQTVLRAVVTLVLAALAILVLFPAVIAAQVAAAL